MDTLIKSTLLSSISAGGRIKTPRQPNIWCGDPEQGYTPGDLIDANGLADFIKDNDIFHDDPAVQRLQEADVQIRQLIDQINESFGNYYTKQETYSASEVDNLISSIDIDLTDYSTTDEVEAAIQQALSSYTVTPNNVVWPDGSTLNDKVGDINSILDEINGEVI